MLVAGYMNIETTTYDKLESSRPPAMWTRIAERLPSGTCQFQIHMVTYAAGGWIVCTLAAFVMMFASSVLLGG